jgi:ABC-type uncharacterized transport system ATPase subunit
MSTILRMQNICKYFPGVKANQDINLEVKKGEVHALLGENGAGKSTLMNVLYGLYTPNSGKIFFNEKEVRIESPKDAINLGIGMVHQHFMLIPALSAVENVVLGMKTAKTPRLDLQDAAVQFKKLAEQYGFDLEPWVKVSQLTVGQQQRLEILKALYRGADLLILDEPTAVLTPQEVEGLFIMIRKLTSEGHTIILITHKLREVMAICDRITVLRGGFATATLDKDKTNPEELSKLMVGREVIREYTKEAYQPKNIILELKNVECHDNRGLKVIKGIDLQLCKGEILGICGVDGNGQRELVDAITGLTKVTEGKVFLNNEEITNMLPRAILDKNVSHIPEDRHKRGVILEMDLVENIMMMDYYKTPYAKGIVLQWEKIKSRAKEVIKDFQVKTPSSNELMKNLSGGNQQKVVLGREISRNPELLIAMHPARGLDVGATEYVHKKIIEARDEGKGVLLISTELDEILALSDRIAVIYEGEIMGIVTPEVPLHELGLMMAGTRKKFDVGHPEPKGCVV